MERGGDEKGVGETMRVRGVFSWQQMKRELLVKTRGQIANSRRSVVGTYRRSAARRRKQRRSVLSMTFGYKRERERERK